MNRPGLRWPKRFYGGERLQAGFGMHLCLWIWNAFVFVAGSMGAVSVPCVWCQSLWSMSDAGYPGIPGGVFSEHVSGYSELVSEWHH